MNNPGHELINDEYFMRLAIRRASEGIKHGQTPFGACIVKDGAAIICEHNMVWENTDITAHAEVTAIREACSIMGTIDLSGCVMYTTCEPCPMCFSACHWARISKIVYGAHISDARDAGFNELTISNTVMKESGGSPVELVDGVLRVECADLFKEWAAHPGSRAY
ncbi:MAG: nucleoside deaminase [Armatimonadota bacterium]